MDPLINKVHGGGEEEERWERQVTHLYNHCAGSGMAANTSPPLPLCAAFLSKSCLDIISISCSEPRL